MTLAILSDHQLQKAHESEAGVDVKNLRSISNAKLNTLVLSMIDPRTKMYILDTIAKHFGISQADAFSEITDIDAEHLLEYLTGSVRTATSLMMQRYSMKLYRAALTADEYGFVGKPLHNGE